MKKLLFTLFAMMLSVAVMAQEASKEKEAENQNGPKLTFEVSEFDFGDVHQGAKVEHAFAFENSGTEPLILSNVQTTCGCTATEWPRDPIAPGEKGEIKVVFNTAGKMSRQNKVVTIISNAVNAQEKVKLIGNILPKKNTDS